jgi:hypothetical protein
MTALTDGSWTMFPYNEGLPMKLLWWKGIGVLCRYHNRGPAEVIGKLFSSVWGELSINTPSKSTGSRKPWHSSHPAFPCSLSGTLSRPWPFQLSSQQWEEEWEDHMIAKPLLFWDHLRETQSKNTETSQRIRTAKRYQDQDDFWALIESGNFWLLIQRTEKVAIKRTDTTFPYINNS